jgi:threonine/homoserine/homoserine lactone efflux protein
MLAAVLGLALVDSLNPSAIAAALYLVTHGRDVVRRVLVYVGAIYVTYLCIGLVLMAGLDVLAGSGLGRLAESPTAYAAQAVLGGAALLYAVFAPGRPAGPPRERVPRSPRLAAVFTLGVLVSVVEFPTALPYLAAISLLTRAGTGPVEYVPILVVYNAVLVLPPLLVLAVARLSGRRLQGRLDDWRQRLLLGSRTAFLTVLGLVGFALLADALLFFEFFGAVDIPPGGSPSGPGPTG